MAERLRQQLTTLRDAQSQQQRSSQERLAALQARLQSLASRVVQTPSYDSAMSSSDEHSNLRHASSKTVQGTAASTVM